MDRFWVGGTANWDATAGTKWATTDGGAGGATVPTSADDVYFTAASGTVTVTVATVTANFKTLTTTGFTGTIAGTTGFAAYGSVTLGSGTIWTNTGNLSFQNVVATFTTNGVSFAGSVNVNSGGTVTLGSALTTTAAIFVNQGTFTTNNYNVTATSLSSSNSNTRTINLGSSTVTLTGTSTLNFSTQTNLTFNAGTSSIVFTNANPSVIHGASGGSTFYDVSLTSTALATATFSGTNTFNNLSITGRSSVGLSQWALSNDQTINGTLTLSAGANATCRTFVRSDTIGTTRTLTCAAVASLTDIDFRDITIAGAAAPVSGTRLGDCKGNSGITFDAAKTVYWGVTTNANWGETSATWSATNGGATSHANFPLAQDTAIFPTAYPNGGGSVTINLTYNIGTIDMSARTSNTMILACNQSPVIYGNWINGTGITLAGTGTLTFAGRGSQTITSAGKTFTQRVVIESSSGSVTLQDAFTCNRTATPLVLSAGILDCNGYNVTLTAGVFNTGFSNARELRIGSGVFTVAGSGTTAFNANPSTNLTVTGTGTISLTSASAKTFVGGDIQTYPTINQGGTGTLTITGSNKFADITNTAIGSVLFSGGTTNEFTAFNLNGVSGNLLQVGSTNTTQVTLKAPSWNVGANSTDAGNNTGLTFSAGSVDYLSISYVNGELTAAPVISVFIIESATGSSSESPIGTYNPVISELATGSEALTASGVLFGTLNESATAADVAEAIRLFLAAVFESTTATDLMAASLTLAATISELTTATDSAAVTSRVTNPTISEAAQMADALSGGLLFLSDISEATTASEIAESVLIFNRAVAEATTASEVLAAVAVFQAAVPEQVSGADVANALLTVGGAINEALTALDAAVAANNITANVGALGQNMALLPLGTSAAGSSLYTNVSFANGASILANGTGTGDSGGFNLGGNYLGFGTVVSGLSPRATASLGDCTDATFVQVTLIAGNGSNGGKFTGSRMDILFDYEFPGPIFNQIRLAAITSFAASNVITVTAPIPSGARAPIGSFTLVLDPAPSPSLGVVWGVKDVKVLFGTATGSDSTTNVYTANPVIAETAIPLDAAQVVASTFSAASVETAIPLDTPQGANTGSSSLSESATVSETQAAQFTAVTAVSEASTAQESASSLAVLSGPIVEAAALADTTSVAPSVFSAVALAAAQAAESFNPAGSIYNASAAVSVVAVDALRRSKLRVVDIEAFVSTGANVTAMTAEATVTGNTVSGTVESGQITATVLP